MNLSTHYQYDPLNRIVQTSYANGIIETLDYDERGNVVKKSLIGSSETREESYVYNGLNQCVETINAFNESTYQHVNAIGQIRQTILPNGESTSYKYDSNGNKIKETRENEDKTKSITTEWVYNEVNQMTQIKEIRKEIQ